MSFDGIVIQRLKVTALWSSLLAGAAYLFFFQPGRTGFFPPCPFRTLTGFNCPGCGTTRGLHELLHGHFLAAFELNPMMVLILPILGYALILYSKSAIDGRPMRQFNLSPGFGWLLTMVIVGFWIFRNTSAYPFPL
jgi:Protein of unknown function (DUF2752)